MCGRNSQSGSLCNNWRLKKDDNEDEIGRGQGRRKCEMATAVNQSIERAQKAAVGEGCDDEQREQREQEKLETRFKNQC